MLRQLTSAGLAMMIGLGRSEQAQRAAAGLGIWLPLLGLLALLAAAAALISFALADWRAYQQRGPRRGYRYRRTAHDRFAPSVELQRQAGIAPAPPAPQAPPDEDDLLRQLLGQ
jgi:hypothetical protein